MSYDINLDTGSDTPEAPSVLMLMDESDRAFLAFLRTLDDGEKRLLHEFLTASPDSTMSHEDIVTDFEARVAAYRTARDAQCATTEDLKVTA